MVLCGGENYDGARPCHYKPEYKFHLPEGSLFGEEIPTWEPQFRDKCQTCGTRMTCNGCSNCGACDSSPKKKAAD